MCTAVPSSMALQSATPELREKLRRRLASIEGEAALGSGESQCQSTTRGSTPDTISPDGGEMEIGDGDSSGSGTDGANSDGSNYEDEEPLDYFMLELASKLPAGEAAALMERMRRHERHHSKVEQRLRKRLSTVSISSPRVSECVEAIVGSPNTAATVASTAPPLGTEQGGGACGDSLVIAEQFTKSSFLPQLRVWMIFLCMFFFVVAGAVALLLQRVDPDRSAPGSSPPPIEFDRVDSFSPAGDPLNLYTMTSDPLAAIRAANAAAHIATSAAHAASKAAADAVAAAAAAASIVACATRSDGGRGDCRLPATVAELPGAMSLLPSSSVESTDWPLQVANGAVGLREAEPVVTAEDAVRKRATDLAMNEAMQQQMRRGMQVAAERLAAEDVQRKAATVQPPAQPAERRAALRERVRALEESGYHVLLTPPDEDTKRDRGGVRPDEGSESFNRDGN